MAEIVWEGLACFGKKALASIGTSAQPEHTCALLGALRWLVLVEIPGCAFGAAIGWAAVLLLMQMLFGMYESLRSGAI